MTEWIETPLGFVPMPRGTSAGDRRRMVTTERSEGEKPMKISGDPEMRAMRRVNNALEGMTRDQRARVLQWAYDKFVATVTPSGEPVSEDRVTASQARAR